MRPLGIFIGKILIILFVCWHVFAVGSYAIPRDAHDTYSTALRQYLIPISTPYMLWTSQWQLWNLFAPDPLRRVTFYQTEVQRNGQWETLELIQPGSYSIWRHAARFKLMLNMLDEFEQNRAPLAGRYMHLLCREHGIEKDTPIRLRYIYYVIPKHEKRQTTAWWNNWKPSPSSYIGFNTVCP